jgi:hypothetical protein
MLSWLLGKPLLCPIGSGSLRLHFQTSRNLLISSFISSMTHWSLNNVLFYCQSIPICRWHDPIHQRPKKFYPTPRHHKQLQCGRIQNQLTKITTFSIHQQWTNRERIYKNNSIYSSLRKISYLRVHLTKDVNDHYKNYKPLKIDIKEDYEGGKSSCAHRLVEST